MCQAWQSQWFYLLGFWGGAGEGLLTFLSFGVYMNFYSCAKPDKANIFTF